QHRWRVGKAPAKGTRRADMQRIHAPSPSPTGDVDRIHGRLSLRKPGPVAHARHLAAAIARALPAAAVVAGVFGATTGPAYAKFDIPTGAPPSPLFGAQPFTQKMLRFEE